MPSTVVLHVGLMKSGTTFVQQQLLAHKELLAERGVLWPARSWGEMVAAVKAGLKDTGDARWDRLTSAVTAHDGTSVVSMELIGPAGPEQRPRFVEALRPARVEVVITARDLNRGLVALWQETIQNGRSWTWDEYVEGVRVARPSIGAKGAPDTGRTFWRQQDLVKIARAWTGVADKVTVVTVPHPGAERTLLLDRFADAAGIERLPLAETRSNESLGLASVLALRQMNMLLDERGFAWPQGNRIRKRILAKTVLAARKRDEPALGLDVPDWLAEEAEVQMAAARELPVELVGDWAELTPVPVSGVRIEDVSEAEVAAAAMAGLAGLVEQVAGGDSDE